MTGYTRQSTFIPGDVIKAEHGNNEFNQLVAAMAQATGHKHDGSSSEGAYVPVISDTTNTNKVEVIVGGARTTGDHDVTGNVTVGGNHDVTGNVDVTGNILVAGTVDGRDVATDGTKLDGIEASATADQTGAEIKTAYEGEADTNAFTDALLSKLNGIEASATADQTGAEIKSLYIAEANTFQDADRTKLDGIETAATADQTGAEIKSLYEAELNTNAFTDAEKTKLSGIETGATADQSASEVPFTPASGLVSTNVQDVAEELGGRIDALEADSGLSFARIEDQKTSGTNAGTFTSGTFQTRTLNTEVYDPDGIVSLSSNQFTLGAGTYIISWSCPAYKVNRHKTRLYNVTDAEVTAEGASEFTGSGDDVMTQSAGSTRVVLAGSKAFEIRHRCQTTAATTGLGINSGYATEVYAVVDIIKVA